MTKAFAKISGLYFSYRHGKLHGYLVWRTITVDAKIPGDNLHFPVEYTLVALVFEGKIDHCRARNSLKD
jgi:hypothetical protein